MQNQRKKPVELLDAVMRNNSYYSIVISNLEGKIGIGDILAKIYIEEDSKKDEEIGSIRSYFQVDQEHPNHGYKQTASGSYMSHYANQREYEEGITLYPVHNFATPIERYNQLNEGQKMVADSIKGIANQFPSAVFWHNGQEDDQCQFIGLHIHMILGSTEQVSQVYKYRQAVQKLKQRGVDVKSQKIRNIHGLGRHLLTPPRMLLGCNNIELSSLLHQMAENMKQPTSEREEKEENEIDFEADDFPLEEVVDQAAMATKYLENRLKINQQSALLDKQEEAVDSRSRSYIRKLSTMTFDERLKEQEKEKQTFQEALKNKEKTLPTSKTANKVDVLKKMIARHSKRTMPELLDAIINAGDRQELDLFRTLRLGPNFQSILLQALSEMDVEAKVRGETYIDKYLQDVKPVDDSLTVYQTANLYQSWCREQGIVSGELLLELYTILNKDYPKINCMQLQGASNAGKTYWTAPLILPDLVGQTIQSSDFIYMNCLNKEIIQIPELCFTKIEQIEEAKKVFEELPTVVNVKNKEPGKLERTPVILTSNTQPWTGFEAEKQALLNRMFSHQNLKESTVLRKEKKQPDPRFFCIVFDYIRSDLSESMQWPPRHKSQYWYLAAESISNRVSDIVEGPMNLQDYVEAERYKEMKRSDQLSVYSYMQGNSGSLEQITLNVNTMDESDQDLRDRVLRYLCRISNHKNEDYFFTLDDYKRPKLYSVLTREEYNVDTDIDEGDYMSFKSGYGLVRRILLRCREWPDFVRSKAGCANKQLEYMMKTCLSSIAQVLLYILRKTRHMNFEADLDSSSDEQLAFNASVKETSTPAMRKRPSAPSPPKEAKKMKQPVKRELKFEAMEPRRKAADELMIEEVKEFGEPVINKRGVPAMWDPKINGYTSYCTIDGHLCITKEGSRAYIRLTSDGSYEWINEDQPKEITPHDARELVQYAFSGNQECYFRVEEETGMKISY